MKLQKVYIKNFRGIKELFLDFKGRTNLIIGVNDCCKTTILEAVDLCFNEKLNQEDLYDLKLSADNNCIIACIFDENIKQDAGEGENFNAIVHKTHIEDGDVKISQDKYLFKIELDKEKKVLEDKIANEENLQKISNATKTKSAVKQKSVIYYMRAIDLDDPSKSSADKNAFEKVIENLNNNKEIKEILKNYDEEAKQQTKKIFTDDDNGIAKILENIFEIKGIDYEYIGSSSLKPSINIVRKYGNKYSKDLSNIGTGVRKIIKFVARLKFDGQQKSIFLIDEPEQNLHPKFQNLLIDFLKDAEIQCIFTSHSPTFVKHCMNSENCEVLICERDKNSEKIMVKPIKEHIKEKKYEFLESHTNSQAVANFLAFEEYSVDLFIYIYKIIKGKAKERYNELSNEEKEKLKIDNGVNKDCKQCVENARINTVMGQLFENYDNETKKNKKEEENPVNGSDEGIDSYDYKKIKKMRNDLAHDNTKINNKNLKVAINYMIEVFSKNNKDNINNQNKNNDNQS